MGTHVPTAAVDGHPGALDDMARRSPSKADDRISAGDLPSWRFVTARRALQEHPIRAELRQHVVPVNTAQQPSQAGHNAIQSRWLDLLPRCHDVIYRGARGISVQDGALILHG